MLTKTPAQLKQMIHTGEILPGSIILTANGEAKGLNKPIAWAQKIALKDLGKIPEKEISEAAKYTHAAVIYDADTIVELYRPRARFRDIDELTGYQVAIILPRQKYFYDLPQNPEKTLNNVSIAGARSVIDGEKYPTKELLYYLKYTTKSIRHWIPFMRNRSFFNLFKDDRYNVCSGAVWRWYRQAGMFMDVAGTNDEFPEAWYPARFYADNRFVVQAKITIKANKQND